MTCKDCKGFRYCSKGIESACFYYPSGFSTIGVENLCKAFDNIKQSKVIAIDFDGTLCENEYPRIGKPRYDVMYKLSKEVQNGAKVILWTCRTDNLLKEAVSWCKSFGIEFDAVNENLPERIKIFNNDCRKIGADEYWDDKAIKV